MSLMDTYLNETVTVIERAKNAWGELGAPVETSLRARVEWKTRKVRDFKGVEVVSRGAALTVQAITEGARIRISGTEYAAIGMDEVQAFRVSHYKVYLA